MLILQANGCQRKNIPNSVEMKNLEEVDTNTAQPQIHDIWALQTINMERMNTENYPEGIPTLEIYLREQTISGFSGCNQYIAPLEKITAKDFQIGSLVSTKKYCASVNEKLYFDNLSRVNSYRIEKMELILFENDLELLRYKKVD